MKKVREFLRKKGNDLVIYSSIIISPFMTYFGVDMFQKASVKKGALVSNMDRIEEEVDQLIKTQQQYRGYGPTAAAAEKNLAAGLKLQATFNEVYRKEIISATNREAMGLSLFVLGVGLIGTGFMVAKEKPRLNQKQARQT